MGVPGRSTMYPPRTAKTSQLLLGIPMKLLEACLKQHAPPNSFETGLGWRHRELVEAQCPRLPGKNCLPHTATTTAKRAQL